MAMIRENTLTRSGRGRPRNPDAVFRRIARVLRERVRNHHYTSRSIPTVAVLAREFGVTVLTMRNAVQTLLDDGVLAWEGRQLIAAGAAEAQRRAVTAVGFLAPAYPSGVYRDWWDALMAVADGGPYVLRLIPYHGWIDPAIPEALAVYDGVFMLAEGENLSAAADEVLQMCAQSGKPVASVMNDLTGQGLPSLLSVSRGATEALMDHAHARGHRRCACINIQAHDAVTKDRVGRWRHWLAARGLEGRMFDYTAIPGHAPWTDDPPEYRAFLRATAEAGAAAGVTAFFATTVYGALGLMTPLREAGLTPGKDVAVMAIDGERIAPYGYPAVTTVDVEGVKEHYARLLAWMAEGGPWRGPMLLEPREATVRVRASTDFVLPSDPAREPRKTNR